MLTAVLVVLGSLGRAWQTQSPDVVVMMALVWGGALCSVEDRLVTLRPRPNGVGMALAVVLLLLAQWRQERIIQPMGTIYLLPMVQGFALLTLAVPISRWKFWRDPLLALALLPFSVVVGKLIPVDALSRLTCRLCQVLFLSFGVDAAVAGRQLILPGGAVEVAGVCSGSGMMIQLMVVSAIFSLVFPMGEGRRRWVAMGVAMAVAPIFAVLANAFRIALLALINASSWSQKAWWFDFFHGGEGGLVFALLAVMAFAPVYFRVQDHLLEPLA
jgi:exosortase/archaeosortase family protein